MVFKKLAFVLMLCASFLMVGCGSSTQDDSKQDTSIQQENGIDFDRLNAAVKKDFVNSKTYPLVRDTDFSLMRKDGKKVIVLTAIVGDSINKQNLLSLADSMLRSYGFHSSGMDDSLSSPTKTSYGVIFDKYDALIIISPVSDTKGKYYIYTSIPAGTQTGTHISTTSDFKK